MDSTLATCSTEHGNRRLLELAARAAGVSGSYERLTVLGKDLEWFKRSSPLITSHTWPTEYWDPLKCNPDAFELAFHLHLEIKHGDGFVLVSSQEGWSSSVRVSSPFYYLEYSAAVRLAITEVAAMIQEKRESDVTSAPTPV